MKKVQDDHVAGLKELGATVTRQKRPQGESWDVGLSGVALNDEVWNHLRKIGHITELDLSKTGLTDDDLPKVNEPEIGSLLLKLNLSNTAITDDGLEKLDSLLLLQDMNLIDTQVTNGGVQRFLQKRATDTKIMKMFQKPTVRLK
jgi:hypothetical protein